MSSKLLLVFCMLMDYELLFDSSWFLFFFFFSFSMAIWVSKKLELLVCKWLNYRLGSQSLHWTVALPC